MDKIFKDIMKSIRKYELIEQELRDKNPEHYKKFIEILTNYFAQEEKIMSDHLKNTKNE